MTYRARCNGRKGRIGRRKWKIRKGKWITVLGNVKLQDFRYEQEGKELDRIRIEEPERWEKMWSDAEDSSESWPTAWERFKNANAKIHEKYADTFRRLAVADAVQSLSQEASEAQRRFDERYLSTLAKTETETDNELADSGLPVTQENDQ